MEPGQISVCLQAGAAFGAGDHPSTRLALYGLQWVLGSPKPDPESSLPACALDVGTGSGILLVAALLLGVREGIGIDTDPCARAEAQENINLNALNNRARISPAAISELPEPVDLVLANLRLPTILQLLPAMDSLMLPGATIVFSGVHPHEVLPLRGKCSGFDWTDLWNASEKGWSAVVFKKK